MTELGLLRNLKIDSSFRPSLKITLDRFSFVDGTELPDDHEKMTDEVLKEKSDRSSTLVHLAHINENTNSFSKPPFVIWVMGKFQIN